jgi:hypothetical protein
MKTKGEKHMKPNTQTPEAIEQLANETGTQSPAADPSQPAMITSEQAVAQLRALLAQVPDVAELTPQERTFLRTTSRIPEPAIRASIQVLAASSDVAQVVAQPADVRQQVEEDSNWALFENEMRAALKRVADGNLVRQKRTRVIATQAYLVAQQLAKTPGNASLAEHVNEVKRLRKAGRHKKATNPAPQTPAPVTGADTTPASPAGANSPASGTTAASKQ